MTGSLADRVRRRLIEQDRESHDTADRPVRSARVAAALRDERVILPDDALLDLVHSLSDEFVGLGPLQPLLRRSSITDILVNGPEQVWIDRGEGLERVDIRFADEAAVRRLAQRLASQASRRLDEAAPCVDARLPGGIRLHAVLPPIATDGTLLSLRIPRRRAFTLEELVHVGSLIPAAAEWLRAVMGGRLAFLVSGGTGSGKTTVLSTLLGYAGSHERLVLVEDSGELRPHHPHVVRLEARPANVEGAGAVSLRDLVRQALRMRPDRLVVGEVRGAEVVDLLAALNTGHEGGCGTVHANSAAAIPARLEALGLMAGLPRDAMHSLVAAGLEAVIHLERGREGKRYVSGIHVMQPTDELGCVAVPALEFIGSTVVRGAGFDQLVAALRGRGIDPPVDVQM